MPDLKPIAQFQNSGVSQEGTLFSCFNHPKKHPRALEGKLVLTQRKAGYLAHVRDRHMTLDRLRISRALHVFVFHLTHPFQMCVIC